MSKLNLESRELYCKEPELFSLSSKIATAEELKKNLIRKSTQTSPYWKIWRWASMKQTPNNDVLVIDWVDSVFGAFSVNLQLRKIGSDVRYVGVYVNETQNPKTLQPNPHLHGFCTVFNRGLTASEIFTEALKTAGGYEENFKESSWGAVAVESSAVEERYASYLTGETLPTLWIPEKLKKMEGNGAGRRVGRCFKL